MNSAQHAASLAYIERDGIRREDLAAAIGAADDDMAVLLSAEVVPGPTFASRTQGS